MRSLLIATVSTIVALSASLAAAGELGVSVVFTDNEISVIRAYYRDNTANNSNKGNGKEKGGKSLPPGIAKNLQRGKPLPPGIAKQVLPTSLIDLLPPTPHGYQRVAIDGKVLLIEIATQVIHDVLEDLILR